MNKTLCKTIDQLIARGRAKLEKADIINPKLESELLLSHLLSLSRFDLYLKEIELNNGQINKFDELLDLRSKRYPLQYIMGIANFIGLDFIVNQAVLIPRPETEVLVEKAIDLIKNSGLKEPSVLDIGTGVGNIAISLTKCLSNCKIWATDISPEALKAARHNASSLGIEDKIIFVLSDIWPDKGNKKFDLIISNPPYIAKYNFANLAPEVKFEPTLALNGGEEGLDFYYRIIKESIKYLNPNGYLLLELGDNQAEAVKGIITSVKEFGGAQIFKDLSDRERVILTRLK